MLSAIAARKARLGLVESQQVEPLIFSDVPNPSPPSSVPPSPVPPRLISKRKPSTQSSNSLKRKKNKIIHVGEKQRYFEEDTFERQDGVIVIGEDSDSEDNEDIGAVDSVTTIPSSASKDVTSRRWSPSIPVRDSSDEETDAGEEPELLPIQTPPQDARIPVLSTFSPIFDQNAFHLSLDEISHLRVSVHTEEMITLILLDPAHTLALLGTYTFTVVQGCISFLGVTISASRNSYRVFAPRSSPIPVMRCLSRTSAPALKTSFLPGRFHSFSDHDGAVVILQEMRTGIQGLGSICTIFDGVFEPSHSPNVQLGPMLLPNVHLV